MERETVCLYDSDPLYGRMILQAIQEEGVFSGEYTYYSELSSLCQQMREGRNIILLLEKEKEEEFYQAYTEQGLEEAQIEEQKKRTLLLSENQNESEMEVYKYLSRSQFINQVKAWWTQHGAKPKKNNKACINHVNGQKLTGVISFAGTGIVQYLQRLKQREPFLRRLVANLEVFPYSLPHDKPKRNLSDLIYYASINRLSTIDLAECIYEEDGIDYIEPIAHYKDGYELDDKVADTLLEYLQMQPYEQIILVTDCRYRGATRLLEQCDEVETEEISNPVIWQKYSTMVQMLHLEQRESLLKKLQAYEQEESHGQRAAV